MYWAAVLGNNGSYAVPAVGCTPCVQEWYEAITANDDGNVKYNPGFSPAPGAQITVTVSTSGGNVYSSIADGSFNWWNQTVSAFTPTEATVEWIAEKLYPNLPAGSSITFKSPSVTEGSNVIGTFVLPIFAQALSNLSPQPLSGTTQFTISYS
jgi:hypothetical protein